MYLNAPLTGEASAWWKGRNTHSGDQCSIRRGKDSVDDWRGDEILAVESTYCQWVLDSESRVNFYSKVPE